MTLNVALAEPVVVDTVTLYEPLLELAVNVPGSATPPPLVEIVVVSVVFENVPLAPEPGAVNTTDE